MRVRVPLRLLVRGSQPGAGIVRCPRTSAGLAQLEERQACTLEATGSRPVAGSMSTYDYMRPYRERRTKERYDRAVELLGGKCANCGAIEVKFEFDHIDPASKSYELSTHFWDYSWNRLLVELAKCQILCTSCHIDKTVSDAGKKPARNGRHGTISTYRYCGPPKCEACKAAKRLVHRAWRKNNGR